MMQDFENFLSRHEKVMFLMSPGKDSAATFRLISPYLHGITVVWVNPGNPFPEVVEYMKTIREKAPHFVELKGEQPWFTKTFGYPMDVVPIQWGKEKQTFVSWVNCCNHNIWRPIEAFYKAENFTGIIKGQKLRDPKNPLVDHARVVDGREVFHPLETWTDEDVYAFLGDDLPPGYAKGLRASMDCLDCTAHTLENKHHYAYLKENHPESYAKVKEVVVSWKARVKDTFAILEDI